jgi:molybdate-binding protein
MKIIQQVRSEEAIKMLGDPTRLEILRILISKQATISQLGIVFNIHPARVRHHVKNLEKEGLVELVSIQMKKNYVEKYYRATSNMFLLNMAVLPEPPEHEQLVILASDDPALNLLVKRVNEKMNRNHIYTLPVGSLDALIYLKEKFSDIAGCHLLDPDSGEYNTPYIHLLFSDQTMVQVNLVNRQQGLIVQKGNPQRIKGIIDIKRDDVLFMNRKRGSGTRMWIDQQMKALGFTPEMLHLNTIEASTHAEVAEAVKNESATVGIGVFSVTKQYDLDFIPLFIERYDLVMSAATFSSPLFQPVMEILISSDFHDQVMQLGGYFVDQMGNSLQI